MTFMVQDKRFQLAKEAFRKTKIPSMVLRGTEHTYGNAITESGTLTNYAI